MKVLLAILSILLLGCESNHVSSPRPHQYPRPSLPEIRSYEIRHFPSCGLDVSIPVYSEVLVIDQESAGKCWFDVSFPDFGATLHCSYYPIESDTTFEHLVNDAFTMVEKHNVRANFREEFEITTKNGLGGLLFKIDGPVASPYQFFVSDTSSHFLRGSFYFNERVDLDSIKPYSTFLQVDVDNFVNSVRWSSLD